MRGAFIIMPVRNPFGPAEVILGFHHEMILRFNRVHKMTTYGCRLWVGIVVSCVLSLNVAMAENASGVVYNDKNRNGVQDRGERGLAHVRVSNGVEVVETDKSGQYSLPVTDDTVIFVIKPKGWMTPITPKDMIPRFYYLHNPMGAPKTMQYPGVGPTGPLPASLDFPLYKQHEANAFKVICMGDTQTRNEEEVAFCLHDVFEEVIGTDAVFGITLGDNVFNDLSVFDSLLPALGAMGIPWRCVPGNHDHNHDAPTSENGADTLKRYLGPNYYAFDYAKVHFIVLDDIRQDALREKYHGGLGKPQLEFVRNDLNYVDPDTLVVLLMHIPVNELEDRNELFALLKDFPHTFSISGHTHTQYNLFIDKTQGWAQDIPHHHLVNATACGSWWGGMFDERGIPTTTMADGVPNGYSILAFKGNTYSVTFKGAQEPDDYQMIVTLPDRISLADLKTTQPIVNVFAGSSRSQVAMQLDENGLWIPMEWFRGKAPNFVQLRERTLGIYTKLGEAKGLDVKKKEDLQKIREELNPMMRTLLSTPDETDHLWRTNLPETLAPGMHTLCVRTTDMYGHTYTTKRVFTVTEK